GNFITLKDAYQKWDPMVLRLFILQSHYRSPLDFSDEALEAAKEGYERLRRTFVSLFEKSMGAHEGLVSQELQNLVGTMKSRVAEAMDDDFNTPLALAAVFDLAREINRLFKNMVCTVNDIAVAWVALGGLGTGLVGGGLKQSVKTESPLMSGVFQAESNPASTGASNGAVQILIDLRNEARAAKNFAQADAIRKRLDDIGIVLEDTPLGTKPRSK
ncbi:MAG: cysteine--tRNA ligase, partial [Planctomycetota bacterium]|nr:cysteine--tRNA ligase [Planctomycetota bacterium]